MKYSNPHLGFLTAALTLFGSLAMTQSASAVVYVTFTEIAPNTLRMAFDGNLQLNGIATAGSSSFINDSGFSDMYSHTGLNGSAYYAFLGSSTQLALTSSVYSPTIVVGVFGYSSDRLYYSLGDVVDTSDGGISSFTVSVTAAANYVDFTGVPQVDIDQRVALTAVAYTTNSGDQIKIGVNPAAVPEPSSTALLGLGGLALMLRRRRRAPS